MLTAANTREREDKSNDLGQQAHLAGTPFVMLRRSPCHSRRLLADTSTSRTAARSRYSHPSLLGSQARGARAGRTRNRRRGAGLRIHAQSGLKTKREHHYLHSLHSYPSPGTCNTQEHSASLPLPARCCTHLESAPTLHTFALTISTAFSLRLRHIPVAFNLLQALFLLTECLPFLFRPISACTPTPPSLRRPTSVPFPSPRHTT